MMADHDRSVDNSWGLQAIFGGSFSDDFGASAHSNSCYGVFEVPKGYEDDEYNWIGGLAFPDLFESPDAMLTDELEHLYKPFYPVVNSDSSSSSSSVSSAGEGNVVSPEHPISIPNYATKEEPREIGREEKQLSNDCLDHPTNPIVPPYTPKYKRRKNQQKREVLQVTAEDLSSDMWAWRKYGQKPIKGSPYPRSYYRCSSSKGCLARKQVEQSCLDPRIFIITYTAEHSHSQPTRKNALAGKVRRKLPAGTTSKKAVKPNHKDHHLRASSSTSSADHDNNIGSPQRRNIKQENNINLVFEEETIGDEQQVFDDHEKASDDKKVINISGFKLEDDFFSGLEDLDGLISKLANGNYYAHY